MVRHYLNVPYREKDEAKALGARFDWEAKQWYVEGSTDLVLFNRWLTPDKQVAASAETQPVSATAGDTSVLDAPAGISLSQLLARIAAAVRQVGNEGVWTIVEIVQAQVRGHVYLEVSERDETGKPVARARAVIWSSTADQILPAFEKATGITIGAGIKLLVLARPVFHIQYGFSLQIDAIDAKYTLGYLEARRREIRARLQREGVFDNNRQLPAPWDFNSVLVVAPHDGAGLGDFRKEAERLEYYGVCQFTYVYSRFQGEGAARDIASAIENALAGLGSTAMPDVVVIIRGGGSAGDLAWLDDYDLSRTICDLRIPVFTGIGHQRDSTIPDEVAHTAFDTPSKVIAGIEQRIRQRSDEAIEFLQTVFGLADRVLLESQKNLDLHYEQVRSSTRGQLQMARDITGQAYHSVGRLSVQRIYQARNNCRHLVQLSREQARHHVTDAAKVVPQLLLTIRSGTQASLAKLAHQTRLDFQYIAGQAQAGQQHTTVVLNTRLRQLIDLALSSLKTAQRDTQGLMREIIGQGPEKTLDRGFAIIRVPAGTIVTSSKLAGQQARLEIQFKDGRLPVKTV